MGEIAGPRPSSRAGPRPVQKKKFEEGFEVPCQGDQNQRGGFEKKTSPLGVGGERENAARYRGRRKSRSLVGLKQSLLGREHLVGVHWEGGRLRTESRLEEKK